MDFKLIKHYDACCDFCNNWASNDIGSRKLQCNKKDAEKILIKEGWVVKEGNVLCGYCAKGEVRCSVI